MLLKIKNIEWTNSVKLKDPKNAPLDTCTDSKGDEFFTACMASKGWRRFESHAERNVFVKRFLKITKYILSVYKCKEKQNFTEKTIKYIFFT